MTSSIKKNPLLAMSAGCIAGGIEATAVWPMEYIKVRTENVKVQENTRQFTRGYGDESVWRVCAYASVMECRLLSAKCRWGCDGDT